MATLIIVSNSKTLSSHNIIKLDCFGKDWEHRNGSYVSKFLRCSSCLDLLVRDNLKKKLPPVTYFHLILSFTLAFHCFFIPPCLKYAFMQKHKYAQKYKYAQAYFERPNSQWVWYLKACSHLSLTYSVNSLRHDYGLWYLYLKYTGTDTWHWQNNTDKVKVYFHGMKIVLKRKIVK